MNDIKTVIAIILLSAISSSCSVFSKAKKNKEMDLGEGLKLTIYTQHKEDKKVDSNDVVLVYYKGMLDDGTVFDGNFDKNALRFTVGSGQVIKGWDMALPKLYKGDSAKIYVPSALAYGDKTRGSIPANSNLTFIVRVDEVLEDPKPFDVAGLDTIDLGDGLKYIKVKPGTGISVKHSNKVKVHYTGYFEDGKIFDTSVGKKATDPFEVQVGRGQVIPGWDKGLIGRQRGEKGRLIIPYQLAYGENGRPPLIPAKSNLIFDIEIMDLEVLPTPIPYNTVGKDTLKTVSGLKYIKVRKNDERPVTDGAQITVEYTGYLMNGDIFDSSIERGEDMVIVVGKDRMIPGFTEAIKLMREGEKMRVIIPYQLAYGSRGIPPVIPPNSDLIFDLYMKQVR